MIHTGVSPLNISVLKIHIGLVCYFSRVSGWISESLPLSIVIREQVNLDTTSKAYLLSVGPNSSSSR